MPASPVITVDSAGVLHWTLPASPPPEWVIENCYADGSSPAYNTWSTAVLGTVNSLDAFDLNWSGGYNLRLTGIDEDTNLVFSPTVSTQVTKDI
jgi:hypothetical protein